MRCYIITLIDIRAKEAVKAALEKAKVCRKPIARYDIETKRAYIEKRTETKNFEV
jgi:hypothetical protein